MVEGLTEGQRACHGSLQLAVQEGEGSELQLDVQEG